MKIPSEKIYDALDSIISKPLGRLRRREEIDAILRRRLTKKEYKLFVADIEGEDTEALRHKLRLNRERLARLRLNVRHKLNLDRIKRELYEEEA